MYTDYSGEHHFSSTHKQGGVIQITTAKGDKDTTNITIPSIQKHVYVPTELDNLQSEAAELRKGLFNAIPPLPSYLREEYRLRLLEVDRQIALLQVEQFKAQLAREQEQYDALMAELPALVKAEADAHAALEKAEQIHDNVAALLDNAHGRERNHRVRMGELKRKLEERSFLINGN